MKHKQLLLILFILVLVGIGILGVLTVLHTKAVDVSHNELQKDLLYYAAKAREFYWRPSALGGGNRSFSKITLPMISTLSSNANGRYFIVGSPTKDEVVICGIGRITTGKDSTRVQVIVNEQSSTLQIIY